MQTYDTQSIGNADRNLPLSYKRNIVGFVSKVGNKKYTQWKMLFMFYVSYSSETLLVNICVAIKYRHIIN